MSVHRRSPRTLLVVALAVPVVVAVYLTAIAQRLYFMLRGTLAALLGATVIGAVYAEEAYLHTPRVSPLRAAAIAVLAAAVVGISAPPAPVSAAKSSPETVIAAVRGYVGLPYRLGATGPRKFDCSGLIFRIFSDAGELPRIGGKRMRAVRYLNWFSARGLTDKKNGERGDLVVWGKGAHIGIYLGDGKAISALADRGVARHGIHAISYKFTTFLKVSWRVGDGTGGDATDGEKGKDKDKDKDAEPALTGAAAGDRKSDKSELNGLATGTMNLRKAADPEARVIGWVSKGSRFTITGTGTSPSGAHWYSIEMRNGKTGWVYSRWVRALDD
jgi:cell wall-associated NlpC family hydrolase